MTSTELRAERGDRPESREVRPGRRRRPLIAGAVALAAIAGFAVAVGYAYQKGRETGTSGIVPIIAANPGPFKVKPDNPGGMAVPNRDMEIYQRMGNAQQPAAPRRETLLPAPEKPMVPPRSEVPPEPPANIATPSIVPPPVAAIQPAEGTAKSIAEASAARASSPPTPAKSEAAAKAEPNAAAAQRVSRVAPSAGGAYRIQLGALRSAEEARGAWSRLQKQHSDLLGSLALSIDRKDVGGSKGVFFRMQAGPLANESDARGLCTRLKQRHVDCLVVSL